jgi:hypothetical protein
MIRSRREVCESAPGKPQLLPCVSSEEDASADAELVLAIALEVSEFGVEVVCLKGADPDVFGDGDVDATADGEGEGCVVGGWKLAHRCGEVAVEAVDASEQRLTKGLEVGVVGEAHSQASHAVEEAQAGVEVGDVAGACWSKQIGGIHVALHIRRAC